MKKENSTFNEMIKPLIVLVVICLVVSALLGVTNSITAPIIEENKRIVAEQTRKSVLEGAESFTEIDCDTAVLGITGAYKEDSGKGYVITAANKGKVIFGIGCGFVTAAIRVFGNYTEGVTFAILLMNILVPYINELTMTKPLGGAET